MIKYFEILLELLNIETSESFLSVASLIEQNPEKKLIVHHRLGFVFEWFWELIHDQISLEEFMALGDVSSSRPLWEKDTFSSLELLQSPKALEKIEQGSMLILDEISFLMLSKVEQEKVQEILEKKEVLLVWC